MSTQSQPTFVILPGFRDHMPEHWQSILADKLKAQGKSVTIVPQIEENKRIRSARVENLNRVINAINGPAVVVAHSIGCMIAVQWARQTTAQVMGALLAAPADLDSPMPAGYATPDVWLRDGWTPVPREPLKFPSIVVGSNNDPLGPFDKVKALADAWGSEFIAAGDLGHLSPADGYGEWPMAEEICSRFF